MKLRLGTDALRCVGGPGNNETAAFNDERRRFLLCNTARRSAPLLVETKAERGDAVFEVDAPFFI